MKEGRTRRQKRFSPGWVWWRWWGASATLTPRNLRKQVVVGLAMLLFQSAVALDVEKEVTTRYPRAPQRQPQLPYPLSKIQRSKKREGPWITVRKSCWAWISILPRENLGWTTHVTEAKEPSLCFSNPEAIGIGFETYKVYSLSLSTALSSL